VRWKQPEQPLLIDHDDDDNDDRDDDLDAASGRAGRVGESLAQYGRD